MKILLLAVGKIKSEPVRRIVDDYCRRISHYLPFESSSCKNDDGALVGLDAQDFLVVLDEQGKQKSSEELALFISDHQRLGTKRAVFFIGGQDGVGKAVRERADLVLGLSRMTFPHEISQALVAEQIYRACSIIRGEPYHRR